MLATSAVSAAFCVWEHVCAGVWLWVRGENLLCFYVSWWDWLMLLYCTHTHTHTHTHT
jgi:hypothetical protein